VLNVDVRRFVPVPGVEEEPVRLAAQDGRHHTRLSPRRTRSNVVNGPSASRRGLSYGQVFIYSGQVTA
jgi:hypothetical protein